MTINKVNVAANRMTGKTTIRFALPLAIVLLWSIVGLNKLMAAGGETPQEVDYPFYPPAPKSQTQSMADTKSEGCITCHVSSDRHTMHSNPAVVLGCTDCHGGDSKVQAPADHNAFVSISSHLRGVDMTEAHAGEEYPAEKPEHADDSADGSHSIDAKKGDHGDGYGKSHKQYKPD